MASAFAWNNMKLFLCHSSKDVAIVTTIRDFLEASGAPCWMAPRDIPFGIQQYEECVVEAIQGASSVIVFLSASSIDSDDVVKEVRQATRYKKPILPVSIDGTVPEDLTKTLDYHLSGPQWIFVNAGAERAAADILAALRLATDKGNNMNASVSNGIAAMFQAKYDWLKREQFTCIGEPDAEGIHQIAGGIWTCKYGNTANPDWCGCTIVFRPGDQEPREVHGKICERWLQEGGVSGWLGYPLSDEEVYKADGDPLDRISHFENGDIICTSKTVSTRIANIKDRVRWYKFKHDQLLDLLRRAVEAPAPERHNEALKAVEDKCKEDQFDVVLLGEFQYGKSTTLDILCCGREVSPQGSGTTPTSAVPVSVQALSADEKEEWGEIRLKSNRELAGELFDTFEQEIVSPNTDHPLKKFSSGEGGSPKDRFCDNFDFDNREHLATARSALKEAWSQYNESGNSKFRFSSRQRQLMEVSTLVVRFYGKDEYRKMLGDTRHSIDGVGGFVWFPSDWSENATKGFDYDLGFDDARFAFVDSVILHIRSPFLAKLGCRVTDCPGLDASAYDKEITRRALLKADGVLFVHKCQKMVGASTLGNLFDFVNQTGRTSKTVLALNLWGIGRDDATRDGTDRRGRRTPCVVNASIQQIRQEHFDFPIVWCHVLLAYLSALGRRRCETKVPFTHEERLWLAEKAQEAIGTQTDEQLWLSALGKANLYFRASALNAISSLDMRAVEEVWDASNFETLLGSVSATVLREKVGSILVDNGSRKALEILIAHETELKLTEEEVGRKASDSAVEFKTAEKTLKQYEAEAKELIRKSYLIKSREDMVGKLAEELTDEILSDKFFTKLSRKLAKIVYDLNEAYKGISETDFAQTFDKEATPLITDLYVAEASAQLMAWQNSPHGRWKKFNQEITELDGDIHDLGARHFYGQRLFDGIPTPGLPDVAKGSARFDNVAKSLVKCLKPLSERLRQGFWSGLWSAFKFMFVGFIIRVLGREKTPDEIREEYSKKILPTITETFEQISLRNALVKGVKPAFGDVFDQIEAELKSDRDKYRVKLQSRWQDLKKVSESDEDEKARIAARNRDIRENRIKPLRKEIEVFEKTVESVVR